MVGGTARGVFALVEVKGMLDASKSRYWRNSEIGIGWGDEQADPMAIVIAYLLRDGTPLKALVGERVWAGDIPRTESYENLHPAVLVRADGGVGQRINTPDSVTRVSVWCYGGTRDHGWTPPDEQARVSDGGVHAVLAQHLWAATMAQTARGVLVMANNVMAPMQTTEHSHEWPVTHSVWEVETKAM